MGSGATAGGATFAGAFALALADGTGRGGAGGATGTGAGVEAGTGPGSVAAVKVGPSVPSRLGDHGGMDRAAFALRNTSPCRACGALVTRRCHWPRGDEISGPWERSVFWAKAVQTAKAVKTAIMPPIAPQSTFIVHSSIERGRESEGASPVPVGGKVIGNTPCETFGKVLSIRKSPPAHMFFSAYHRPPHDRPLARPTKAWPTGVKSKPTRVPPKAS